MWAQINVFNMNPLTNDLIIPHPLLLSSHCRCMESNQVWALWLGNKFVLQALKTVLKFIKRGDLQEKNCMHVLNLKWAKIYHWQTRASTFNTYKKLIFIRFSDSLIFYTDYIRSFQQTDNINLKLLHFPKSLSILTSLPQPLQTSLTF